MNIWWQRTIHRYSVSISSPRDNGAVGATADIVGRAKLPADWNLVVLVQTPDQLQYYVQGGGAITVAIDGSWSIPAVPFGSTNPEDRKLELNMDYKIVALLLDSEGQEQVQAALAKPVEQQWLSRVPQHAARAISKVHLNA